MVTFEINLDEENEDSFKKIIFSIYRKNNKTIRDEIATIALKDWIKNNLNKITSSKMEVLGGIRKKVTKSSKEVQ